MVRPGSASADTSDQALAGGTTSGLRERIVSTARRSFERNGYRATTIAGVATAAGVDVPTVHAHFRSENDLLAAAYADVLVTAEPLWTALDDTLVGRAGTLTEWMEGAVRWWEKNERLIRAVREAAVLQPDLARAFNGWLEESVKSLEGFLGNRTEDETVRATLTVQMLMVQYDQVCSDMLGSPTGDVERERAISVLSEIWTQALRPWRR